MKLVVVIDSPTSAIGRAAQSRSRFQECEIVSTTDFPTVHNFLRRIEALKPDVLFFAWRGALGAILKSKSSTRFYIQVTRGVSVGILIPDLVGLSADNRELEFALLNSVDFHLVTSKELWDLYLQEFSFRQPLGLYRDIPNLNALRECRRYGGEEKLERVIWVGNSTWGERHGFKDHKGLKEIVQPLQQKLQGSLDFKIIDSSRGIIANYEVLDEIAKSRILIQTSKSEGTGLPLLEAAALGTLVVTSDVGIARDFLIGDLEPLVVDRFLEGFIDGILYASSNIESLQEKLALRFCEYLTEIEEDTIPLDFGDQGLRIMQTQTSFFSTEKLKWFRRWLIAHQYRRQFGN